MPKLLSSYASIFARAVQTTGADFYAKLLYHALESYAKFLPNEKRARDIFNITSAYQEQPSYSEPQEMRQLGEIEGAIEEAEYKLHSFNVDPLAALKSLGMTNVNPSMLTILLDNLKTLKEGRDFSGYKHYTLSPRQIQEPDIIELDKEPDPGY